MRKVLFTVFTANLFFNMDAPDLKHLSTRLTCSLLRILAMTLFRGKTKITVMMPAKAESPKRFGVKITK